MKKQVENQRRTFSESFKKEKVKLIETKKFSVLQISRVYSVSSTAVYKWISKYGTSLPAGERLVIEKESEGQKQTELLRRQSELEQKIGRQELEIDYLKKVIEHGSELLGADIEKKFESGC